MEDPEQNRVHDNKSLTSSDDDAETNSSPHSRWMNRFELHAKRCCICYPCVLFILLMSAVTIYLLSFHRRMDSLVIQGTNERAYPTIPGTSTTEHWIFFQLTDVHLNKFNSQKRENLEWFVQEVLPAVATNTDNSSVGVFATGDLTDGYAKASRHVGKQQLEEWQDYSNTLAEQLSNTTPFWFWEDLRGNHDALSTGSPDNLKENLYETFGRSSVMARAREPWQKRAWRRDVSFGNSTVRFVGMDATPEIGAGSPFNFYGVMTDTLRRQVLDLIGTPEQLRLEQITEVVLLGHFPQNSIRGGLGSDIRKRVSYYLCGHFHEAHMKQRLPHGDLIELEALDLKDHGGYRMLVFDHGQLSFAELTMDDPWPAVVVGNPKDARYLSAHEPRHAQLSTHVRVHAYTSIGANITQVLVGFDDEEFQHPAAGEALFVASTSGEENSAPGGGGLFALGWDPHLSFGDGSGGVQGGLHTLHLRVTDSEGRIRSVAQKFSFDGTTAPIGRSFVQNLQAVGDVTMFERLLLALFVLGNVGLLVVNRDTLLAVKSPESGRWARAMAVFLLFFVIDFAVGPYIIAEVVERPHVSIVFSYGMWHPSAVNPSGGLTLDPQTVVFALMLQGMLVFPFVVWLLLHIRDHPNCLSPHREPIDLRLFPKTLFGLRGHIWSSWTEVGRSLVKVFLPIYCIFISVVLLRAFAIRGNYSPLLYFASPAFWFGYLVILWIVVLLSSTPAIPDRTTLVKHEKEEEVDENPRGHDIADTPVKSEIKPERDGSGEDEISGSLSANVPDGFGDQL